MTAIRTYACNICSTQKKETNRWFKVFLIKGEGDKPAGVLLLEWDALPNTDPVLSATKSDFEVEHADAHLCGLPHLLEWVSKKGIAQ